MDKVILLEELASFTTNAVKDLVMPTKPQKGDTEQGYRTADVYKMRLPDSNSAQKKAPYIIHQIITGKDGQLQGQREESTTVVRSIFCVYNEDEQEGALMLLNLMERLRIKLLRERVIGQQFSLAMEPGIECLIYPDDTAPFYAGEMVTNWQLPSVEREVIL